MRGDDAKVAREYAKLLSAAEGMGAAYGNETNLEIATRAEELGKIAKRIRKLVGCSEGRDDRVLEGRVRL